MIIKKLLGIVVLSLFWSSFGFANTVTKFKCNFERDNYEYTINLYEKEFNELHLLNKKSKETYLYNIDKRSVDITVINGNGSYNFKGFKNNNSNLEHYFVFIDQSNLLYAYLTVKNYKGEKNHKLFDITSFDNALDFITKGTCEAFY